MRILEELNALGNVTAGHTPPSTVGSESDYTVEADRITESEWSQCIQRFADANIYQTWAYGAERWGEKNLSHLVLKRGNDVHGLAQLRIVRPGGIKAGIAYLRWGPLCHIRGKTMSPETVVRLARALWEEYVQRRGLYLQILPNAFVGSPRAQIFEAGFGWFDRRRTGNFEKYRTFVLDLTLPLDDLRKKLDRKWRNHLNAAERKGLTIIEGNGPGDYRRFCRLYDEMWKRKKFRMNVSVRDFEQIQERLPEVQKMRVLICENGRKPAAGLICSAMGESAIYLLGATNAEGMNVKGAYLLQWDMIRRLKESGIRFYDLGGIDPVANPGVYQFKRGLSGADVSHISSFTACHNRFSAVLASAGQLVRNAVRGGRRLLTPA